MCMIKFDDMMRANGAPKPKSALAKQQAPGGEGYTFVDYVEYTAVNADTDKTHPCTHNNPGETVNPPGNLWNI